MALGGYGPNQYFNLLQTKAFRLKPRLIICGLYMGDDFENAFMITYGLEHWANLRALPPEKVNFDIWEAPQAPTWHKKIRLWLSRHSVTYQLLIHASVLGRLQGEVQIRNAHKLNSSATALFVPAKHIEEAFVPKGMLRRLDQSNPSVREGMRITFYLLKQMNDICQQNHVGFVVAVIPTKEMVFSEYLEHDPNLPLGDTIDQLLVNERVARERTFAFLSGSNIRYADTLPALKRFREQGLYARSAGDMHPGRNGYRVIAQAIFEGLQQQVVQH